MSAFADLPDDALVEAPTHDPVMLAEILAVLALRSGDVAVDGTLGLAGHAREIGRVIGANGTLVGLDWDETMLARAETRLREVMAQTHLVHADYREMPAVMERLGLRANGILLDLGLNSAQIDDPSRGIAFKYESPLDMRMDRSRGEPASALLNRLSPVEIERILWNNGDERWAKAIAKQIVEQRREAPLRTTTDLVNAVLAAVPPKARDKRIHPATRVFQAVRIAVNLELEGLEEAVEGAARCLAEGGTLAVLSYHSGEDRAVKTVFRALAAEGWEEVFRKPEVPTAQEVARNPRSRSAKLRAVRRRTA